MPSQGLSSIVVGVDGSDGSRRAAVFARDMADAFSAQLTLVLAIEPFPHGTFAGLGVAPEQLRAHQLAAGQVILEDLCRDLDLDPANTALVIGSAAEVLCAEAEDRDADLIVVGARGHGPHRVNAGSVGVRLMNMANRSITVVR